MKIMGSLKTRIRRNPYVFLMALAAVPILAIGLAERTVGQSASSGSQSGPADQDCRQCDFRHRHGAQDCMGRAGPARYME